MAKFDINPLTHIDGFIAAALVVFALLGAAAACGPGGPVDAGLLGPIDQPRSDAGFDDPAMVDHIGAIGKLKRIHDILLDQQDRDTGLVHRAQAFCQQLDRARRESE